MGLKPAVAKAYMCGTDWAVEAFAAPDFPVLYKTDAQLKRERVCWRECGIVQVEVRLAKVVKKGSV